MRLRSIPSRTMRSLWRSGSAPGPREASGRPGIWPDRLGGGDIGYSWPAGGPNAAFRPGAGTGHNGPATRGQVHKKRRQQTGELVVSPRPEQAAAESLERTGAGVELRVVFPGGGAAADATWRLEGDVLEVEHVGLVPAYYGNFLVPRGWNPAASVEGSELRILVTPPDPAAEP